MFRQFFFSSSEEKEICKIKRRFYEISPEPENTWHLRKIAYIYAEKTAKNCAVEWREKELAGIFWVKKFMERNKIKNMISRSVRDVEEVDIVNRINEAISEIELENGLSGTYADQ